MGSGGTPEARALAAQSDLASSQKSPAVAFILCIFLGIFGAHRFYLRRTGSAVAMLLITVLTAGAGAVITFIWEIVDLFLINGMVQQANAEILTGVQHRHGLAVSNYPPPGGAYGAPGYQAPGGYAAPGSYSGQESYGGPGALPCARWRPRAGWLRWASPGRLRGARQLRAAGRLRGAGQCRCTR